MPWRCFAQLARRQRVLVLMHLRLLTGAQYNMSCAILQAAWLLLCGGVAYLVPIAQHCTVLCDNMLSQVFIDGHCCTPGDLAYSQRGGAAAHAPDLQLSSTVLTGCLGEYRSAVQTSPCVTLPTVACMSYMIQGSYGFGLGSNLTPAAAAATTARYQSQPTVTVLV